MCRYKHSGEPFDLKRPQSMTYRYSPLKATPTNVQTDIKTSLHSSLVSDFLSLAACYEAKLLRPLAHNTRQPLPLSPETGFRGRHILTSVSTAVKPVYNLMWTRQQITFIGKHFWL
jgi:hypothetical protein